MLRPPRARRNTKCAALAELVRPHRGRLPALRRTPAEQRSLHCRSMGQTKRLKHCALPVHFCNKLPRFQARRPHSGALQQMESGHGVRNCAFFSWRHEGAIRSYFGCCASRQAGATTRSNFSCSRSMSGRLDDHGRARLQGELGAIPRQQSDAANEARYRRRLHRVAAHGEYDRNRRSRRFRRGCRRGACRCNSDSLCQSATVRSRLAAAPQLRPESTPGRFYFARLW